MVVVRVLVDSTKPQTIADFYTLSAAHFEVAQLSTKAQHKLPRYAMPFFLTGRFALASKYQAKDVGKLLMGCAVARCLEAKKRVVANALLADAKDDSAKAFYAHYGFTACRDKVLRLYFPLGA